jgi:hypothetical protein
MLDGKPPQAECGVAGHDVGPAFAVLWSNFTAPRSTRSLTAGSSGQMNVTTKALWSMHFPNTSSKLLAAIVTENAELP